MNRCASRLTQANKYETEVRVVDQVFLRCCDSYLRVGNKDPTFK